MQTELHPNYAAIKVNCSCGNIFETGSTLGHDLHVEVCNKCHPYYTGSQKIVDTQGRVDTFANRFAGFTSVARKKQEDK